MNKNTVLVTLCCFVSAFQAAADQTYLGQSAFRNTSGREVMICNDNGDSTLTFHDSDDAWYTMGIDYSDGIRFKLNIGEEMGRLVSVIVDTGKGGIGTNRDSYSALSIQNQGFGDFLVNLNNRALIRVGSDSASFSNNVFRQNEAWVLKDSGLRAASVEVRNSEAIELYGAKTIGSLDWQKTATFDGSGQKVNFPTGNVVIGTASPDYRLDVKGTIRAEEIIMQTIWAGFVFDADYSLLALSEVEAHIDSNGHLPGVPSAEEVALKGFVLEDIKRFFWLKLKSCRSI